jgi:hypothetical protein
VTLLICNCKHQPRASTTHDININDDDGATQLPPPHLDGDNDNEGLGLEVEVYGGNVDDNGPK